jgi:N-acetylmuramoyl-L-alanine amidase
MKFLRKYRRSIFLGWLSLIVIFVFLTSGKKTPLRQGTGYKLRTVVIDAGHGGNDPGCLGEVINEKSVALGIAMKLGKYINENFPDVKVVYTRNTDVFIPLTDRARIANEVKADLFISVHANANPKREPYGTETYVMGVGTDMDRNTDIVKTRENSVIFLEKDYKKNYDGMDPNDPASEIIANMIQKEKLDQSLYLASRVQTQFETRMKLLNRGVKQRVLYVMYRTVMPSILVETGFLTNKEDEKYLSSEKGQAYVASCIFRAFRMYKMQAEGRTSAEIKAAEEADFAKQSAEIGKMPETLSVLAGKVNVDTVKDPVETVATPKESKKIPEDTSDLIFKVQLTSSSKKIELTSPKFKGLDNVQVYEGDGSFKYTAGKCKSMAEAAKLQKKAMEIGFKDAFVVAFYRGQRVSMKRVNEIMAEKK